MKCTKCVGTPDSVWLIELIAAGYYLFASYTQAQKRGGRTHRLWRIKPSFPLLELYWLPPDVITPCGQLFLIEYCDVFCKSPTSTIKGIKKPVDTGRKLTSKGKKVWCLHRSDIPPWIQIKFASTSYGRFASRKHNNETSQRGYVNTPTLTDGLKPKIRKKSRKPKCLLRVLGGIWRMQSPLKKQGPAFWHGKKCLYQDATLNKPTSHQFCEQVILHKLGSTNAGKKMMHAVWKSFHQNLTS